MCQRVSIYRENTIGPKTDLWGLDSQVMLAVEQILLVLNTYSKNFLKNVNFEIGYLTI